MRPCSRRGVWRWSGAIRGRCCAPRCTPRRWREQPTRTPPVRTASPAGASCLSPQSRSSPRHPCDVCLLACLQPFALAGPGSKLQTPRMVRARACPAQVTAARRPGHTAACDQPAAGLPEAHRARGSVRGRDAAAAHQAGPPGRRPAAHQGRAARGLPPRKEGARF